MKSTKSTSPFKIFITIFRNEPAYLLFALPQVLINSGVPLLYVYFPKLFIEQLTLARPFESVAKSIGIYIGILLISNIVNSFLLNKSSFYADRFAKKMRQRTGDITMSLPLEDMEGTEYKEKLALANGVTQITEAAVLLQKIISNIITIVGLVFIIFRLDLIFVLIIAATLCVRICFVIMTNRYHERQRKLHAANDRKGNYLNQLAFFNQGAAKEIRTNNIGCWFMEKIMGYRNEMLKLQYASFKHQSIYESIAAIVMAIQSFVILWVLVIRFTDGLISIADFTMYFSAITTLTATLSIIIGIIGDYMRLQLNMGDFEELDNIIGQLIDTKKDLSYNNIDIVYNNVSFVYPNSANYALKDINITIRKGEKIAIVGENGAGKSTFIKLLCRFYKPTSGTITIGGIDIWNIDQATYAKLVSAVFQDYQNFAFSIYENIAMGQSNQGYEMHNIINTIGLDSVIKDAPQGAETYLTRNFSKDGIELSGGESQKLAIARAVYKNSAILILDEPTASLDPKAEDEIYQTFFRVSNNKITLFVSHRLASSTSTDRIVVFENGQIVELGDHSQLMQYNGIYASMFKKQSAAYLNSLSERDLI